MEQQQQLEEVEMGRSLAYTPTWAIAAVTTILVGLGFLAQRLIHVFGNWLLKTKRRALLEALGKIKEELMVFGLISLLLGQWAEWVSKICLRSSVFSSQFYMCSIEGHGGNGRRSLLMDAGVQFSNNSFSESWRTKRPLVQQSSCPVEHEQFISYESLVQLHHFLFVLGITHVIYCCMSIALTIIKIYSWSIWESQASTGTVQDSTGVEKKKTIPSRQSSFVFHHTSHPWSKNKVLIWMFCFFHQFRSSINKSDYMALRIGFIMKHNLPLTYNFHNYLSRSMEDEFRDIVGLSWLLWAYAIFCIFLNFHGTNMYFWLSFIPAILILLVGAKLHHIVVQLALEIVSSDSEFTEMQPRPRDELFWFGKPKLLLWLIQFISFQNAFEMATFIWSLWEIKSSRCFMKDSLFLVTRLSSGVLVQFWCSYGVLPHYVIIAQMGSKFKKTLVSEKVRESLRGWRKRVQRKTRKHHSEARFGSVRSTSFKTVVEEIHADNSIHPSEVTSPNADEFSLQENYRAEHVDPSFDEPIYDTYSDEDDELCLLSP